MPTAPSLPRLRRRYHHPPHHLDLASAREVPDSHAWPDLDARAATDLGVPVVDLSAADVVSQIAPACATWGAFQIIGHGVPLGLLRAAEAAARRLFELPASRKLRAARATDGGSGGYGPARISCFFPKLMWSEGFTIAGSPQEHARALWPDGDALAFCDVIEEYKQQMQRLARRLMRLLLLSLDLSDLDANWAGLTDDLSAVLHLNSYPVCPDPGRAMGLAPHTDSTLITILYQSDTTGLQVLQPRDDGTNRPTRWVTVPPTPTALIVNIGDLFQILSNGRYKSVIHRAMVNLTSHRVSVAYMCGPSKGVKLSPMKKLIRPGYEPMYRGVTWTEYLSLKGKLFDEALPSLTCHGDMEEYFLHQENMNTKK